MVSAVQVLCLFHGDRSLWNVDGGLRSTTATAMAIPLQFCNLRVISRERRGCNELSFSAPAVTPGRDNLTLQCSEINGNPLSYGERFRVALTSRWLQKRANHTWNSTKTNAQMTTWNLHEIPIPHPNIFLLHFIALVELFRCCSDLRGLLFSLWFKKLHLFKSCVH